LSGFKPDQFILNLESLRPFEYGIVFPRFSMEVQAMARPDARVGSLGGWEVQESKHQMRGLKPRRAIPDQPAVLVSACPKWDAASPITSQLPFTLGGRWRKLFGNIANTLFVPMSWCANADVFNETLASHNCVRNLGPYQQDLFWFQRDQSLGDQNPELPLEQEVVFLGILM
jgi:hypothetical protein